MENLRKVEVTQRVLDPDTDGTKAKPFRFNEVRFTAYLLQFSHDCQNALVERIYDGQVVTIPSNDIRFINEEEAQ